MFYRFSTLELSTSSSGVGLI